MRKGCPLFSLLCIHGRNEMNKRLVTLIWGLLLVLGYAGMAQATYYHFEDYQSQDIYFATGTVGTWEFDLNSDALGLWVIPSIPLTSGGIDWDPNDPSYSEGSMSDADTLHRAYLTMRFCSANGDVIDMLFDDILFWNDASISTGGTGTINVFSQLYDDHFLKVTIVSVLGDFRVDWMNLAGCFESATPVPEPGTLLLLGCGLIGLAFVLAKRS